MEFLRQERDLLDDIEELSFMRFIMNCEDSTDNNEEPEKESLSEKIKKRRMKHVTQGW
jgi:hypothetical protein